MIPKIIHCCWLSGEAKDKLAQKCRASWEKFAPGWEIREWNLENLGVGDRCSCTKDEIPSFVWKAVEARKWAFAADWVRFAALKTCGGVYFDYDFELVKPIEELPEGEWCAGQWLPNGHVAPEPAAIALETGSPIAGAMLKHYEMSVFDDRTTVGEILAGLQEARNLKILDPEVMSPIGVDGKLHRTDRTVGIHWYAMSWASPKRKIAKWLSWHGLRPVVDFLLKLRK